MKVLFFHLYNDFSGSPKVLKQVLDVLQAKGKDMCVYVGKDGTGILDTSPTEKRKYFYKRSNSKIITLFNYFVSQCHLFLLLLFSNTTRKTTTIYVNTLLPFGAAIYGKLTGKRVIYHLHEVSVHPRIFLNFLIFVAKHTADKLIYVSKYHFKELPINLQKSEVLYNTLSEQFEKKAKKHNYLGFYEGVFNVVMLASLRDYKGIPEYISLAELHIQKANIHFHLVPNAEEHEIKSYFKDLQTPTNLTVHPMTKNPSNYYKMASVVLNLSNPDQWIETFGLTILEAMAFGIPVIAPPVGGPTELIEDGVEGFLVDGRETDKISECILRLYTNKTICKSMSNAAKEKSQQFSRTTFDQQLTQLLQ